MSFRVKLRIVFYKTDFFRAEEEWDYRFDRFAKTMARGARLWIQ